MVWTSPQAVLQGGQRMHEQITSLQNPKIKKAARLSDRRERDQTGLFLIEGYRELKKASDSGIILDTLFICPGLFLGSNEYSLIDGIQKKGAEILSCSESVFRKLSYRDRPDGLVAVATQMRRSLQDLIAILTSKKDPFLVIAEAIEKPGNLGTILRSADAAGVDCVIVCDRCTDIYNPNVVRASVGTLFTAPVIEASGSETLALLQHKNIRIAAATPSASLEFTDADLTGPLAIAVGTEQLGLSSLWMKASDIHVRIPMHGVADSLNVATATTLLLYEVVRQNRGQRCRYTETT